MQLAIEKDIEQIVENQKESPELIRWFGKDDKIIRNHDIIDPKLINEDFITSMVFLCDPEELKNRTESDVYELFPNIAFRESAIQIESIIDNFESIPNLPEGKSWRSTENIPTKVDINIFDKPSKLIEDLNDCCNSANQDWRAYVGQTQTGRAKNDFVAGKNREIYLNKIVPLQAFELYEIIKAIIEHHDYPKSDFGDYEEIMETIKTIDDNDEKAKLLRRLVMIAESKVPTSIRYQKPRSISPRIGKTVIGST